jgi:alpha-N-arabinofuranosidase
LQAMILTQGEKMLVTPTGYVYEMYAPHQGGTSLRIVTESDAATYTAGGKEQQVTTVSGSASRTGKVLFLTLTNAHATDAVEVTVDLLGGAQAAGGAARILSGEIHAHNTFDAPETLTPRPYAIDATGASFVITLPPASVLAAEIALG